MTEALPPRPKLNVTQKLRIMARYCRCPGVPERGYECGKHFGKIEEVEWDHIGMRAFTGDDTEANFRPLCHDCHQFKTTGRKGEKFVTSAGSDVGQFHKMDRLAEDHEAFRNRLLTRQCGEPYPRKNTIKSRPFTRPKRKKKARSNQAS
jgi:hypothetical protein